MQSKGITTEVRLFAELVKSIKYEDILIYLREKTGKDFIPIFMSLEYVDIMQYMLENNCKLEQEIISWSEQEW